MNGVVNNGWPFVWAAYSLTALILGGYVTLVITRVRQGHGRSR
jgi:hypothetical protein